MKAIVSRNVRDLPASERLSLERITGRALGADQQVLIVVVDADSTPSDADRERAAIGIRQIIAEARVHADRLGISEEEADAAVEEAMASVRRRA